MANETHARGSRRKVTWNGVEITERQKEILELWEKFKESGASNVAQAVAGELGITPNAVYIAKKRVKDAFESNGNTATKQPFGSPKRTVSLDDYRKEDRVQVSNELAEIAQMTQQKLVHLTEVENELEASLNEVRRAKDGLNRVMDNIAVSEQLSPTPAA